jgi:DNA repair protein RecO (recombination protein O)
MSRELEVKGIILRKTPFKETSYILEVFTSEWGQISVIAKGANRPKSRIQGMLERANELEMSLYHNPDSDWYVLKTAAVIHSHLHGQNYETMALIHAGIEIYLQLIITEDEAEKFYNLLSTYFLYIVTVKKNGVAVFWRFLLRLTLMLGIPMNLNRCVFCDREDEELRYAAFFPQKDGFACRDCSKPVNTAIPISKESAEILAILNKIGIFLDSLTISSNTIKEINNLFLVHFSHHFHKKFTLKSLDALCQTS